MTQVDQAVLERCKDRAVVAVGGVSRMAEKLNVTRSAVSQWSKVPAERVGEVSRLTGYPPHEVRPDIFAPPADALA